MSFMIRLSYQYIILDPGDYVLEVYLLEGYQRPVRRVTAPLVSAPISLVGSAKHLSGFNTLLVETGEETVEVQYQLWSSDFFNFGYPLYRYRATIPIVWHTDLTLSSNQTVALKLIAPDGRVFEPLNPSGNLRSFVVDPDWPSGLYRLNIEVLRQGEVIGSETSPNLLQVENVERQFVLPPMTQQVNANFYDVIKLWGYDLSASRLQPGDVLSISAYWESLRTINQRLRIFNHLYDMNNKLWLANDYYAPPYRGGTIMWVPGQIVADEFSDLARSRSTPWNLYCAYRTFSGT